MDQFFFENEKKLFTLASTIAASANADWTQPTYRDALAMSKQRGESWGFPVGVRASANWELCPALTLPTGVAGTTCSGTVVF